MPRAVDDQGSSAEESAYAHLPFDGHPILICAGCRDIRTTMPGEAAPTPVQEPGGRRTYVPTVYPARVPDAPQMVYQAALDVAFGHFTSVDALDAVRHHLIATEQNWPSGDSLLAVDALPGKSGESVVRRTDTSLCAAR